MAPKALAGFHLHLKRKGKRTPLLGRMSTLILDNGSYEIKVGYSTHDRPVHVMNAISQSRDRRVYLADEINDCKDYAGLVFRRPHEKGQLVSWECEKAIWDHILFGKRSPLSASLGSGAKPVVPSETCLILTEMPWTLPTLSSNMDQIVFEEYEFDSYYRCVPASLVPWNRIGKELFRDTKTRSASPVSECTFVVDSGYNATHIVPMILGEVYWPAVRRVDVGGRLLTNLLKETVSFRYYDMMDESYIMNLIKEQTCFVSQNYKMDIEDWYINQKKSKFEIQYKLPDYTTTNVGYVIDSTSSGAAAERNNNKPHTSSDPQQILTLNNERFTVPEVLFNPSYLGKSQSGIPEAIIESMKACPEEVWPLLMANIVLTGGNSKLPGYKQRIEHELQSWTPQGYNLRVGLPNDPLEYAWKGGKLLGSQPDMLKKAYVTRQDYLEHGANICLSNFGTKSIDVVSQEDE